MARHARDFDPEQWEDWFAASNLGHSLGYHDVDLLARLRAFGRAIWWQSDTALSAETEQRIRTFVRWVRLSGVGLQIDDGVGRHVP